MKRIAFWLTVPSVIWHYGRIVALIVCDRPAMHEWPLTSHNRTIAVESGAMAKLEEEPVPNKLDGAPPSDQCGARCTYAEVTSVK